MQRTKAQKLQMQKSQTSKGFPPSASSPRAGPAESTPPIPSATCPPGPAASPTSSTMSSSQHHPYPPTIPRSIAACGERSRSGARCGRGSAWSYWCMLRPKEGRGQGRTGRTIIRGRSRGRSGGWWGCSRGASFLLRREGGAWKWRRGRKASSTRGLVSPPSSFRNLMDCRIPSPTIQCNMSTGSDSLTRGWANVPSKSLLAPSSRRIQREPRCYTTL
mmetsp:Transcript_14437/g.34803  ORF Transcript_14437/g.34803 Transcript_14437/m.34803 type:complete len:218 (+) Transcript_14437:683-1336(+)